MAPLRPQPKSERESDALQARLKMKKTNDFGLFDTLGRAPEHVFDFYDADFYRVSPKQDPKGPEAPKIKQYVVRGGIANYQPGQHLRSAIERKINPSWGGSQPGIRLVLEFIDYDK